jgi:hypothetical protein
MFGQISSSIYSLPLLSGCLMNTNAHHFTSLARHLLITCPTGARHLPIISFPKPPSQLLSSNPPPTCPSITIPPTAPSPPCTLRMTTFLPAAHHRLEVHPGAQHLLAPSASAHVPPTVCAAPAEYLHVQLPTSATTTTINLPEPPPPSTLVPVGEDLKPHAPNCPPKLKAGQLEEDMEEAYRAGCPPDVKTGQLLEEDMEDAYGAGCPPDVKTGQLEEDAEGADGARCPSGIKAGQLEEGLLCPPVPERSAATEGAVNSTTVRPPSLPRLHPHCQHCVRELQINALRGVTQAAVIASTPAMLLPPVQCHLHSSVLLRH